MSAARHARPVRQLTTTSVPAIRNAVYPVFRALLGRVNLTLLGLGILGATFWLTDRITNQQPAAPRLERVAATARPAGSGGPRVFIYVIDSLRFETAIDPEIMPALAALRGEGAHARMMTGFNSGTAASFRDAFTGRENAAVLAAVATFVHTDAGVESIFHQMALRGLTTAAYSMGFFRQFGAAITREVELGLLTSPEQQEAHVLAAVDAFRTGAYDCVIAHLAFTDHVAHEEGVGTDIYRAAFGRADALIPRLRAQLPADVTFVVTGDHGHDLKGKHGVGLEVPTFAVYVGPRFRSNADLGTTSVMSHRYLLSHALDLPLTQEKYVGDVLPAALSPGRAWPNAPLTTPPVSPTTGSIWIWVYLGLCAALWFNLVWRVRSPLDFSRGREFALWLGIVPLGLRGGAQVGSAVAALALLGWLLARHLSARQLALWIGAPTAMAVAFQGWGRVLRTSRDWVEQISYADVGLYWTVVVAVAAVLATRRRRPVVMGVVMAVPALFFPPTNYHYGFPATFAPLLGCWFVLYAVSVLRDGAWRRHDGEAGIRGLARLVVAAAALFVVLQPIAVAEAQSGAFHRWHALLDGWEVGNTWYFALAAGLGKVVLFFPRRARWSAVLLGLACIVVLQLIEARYWRPDVFAWRRLSLLMLAGWAAGAWFRRPEARICGFTFLFLLYYDFVALTPRNFMETSVMIGALVLCAQVMTWFPQREHARADYVVLGLLGLLMAGWASMRWSGTHLEWHAVYEWVSSATLERHVGWFVPWIALKGLVPWFILGWALRERLAAVQPFPAGALLVLLAAKILLLLMVTIGLGDADTFNRSYLEAACVVAVFTVLYLGVILLPGAWPEYSSATTARATRAVPEPVLAS